MLRVIPSTVRQIGNTINNCKSIERKFALKNETTAVQIELKLLKKTWVRLEKVMTLPWEGLIDSLRIEVETDCNYKISFEEDILDDDLTFKKDLISSKRDMKLNKGYNNLWLDLCSDTSGEHDITVRVLSSIGFEDEKLVDEIKFTFEVSDIEMPKKNDFYLDLWQHLCSLARVYEVEYFSDEHFRIIENFIKPLEQAGQKVCDLIVSDYSWAGQECFLYPENNSSLFEYNIIKTTLKNGKLNLDFTAFDRYINLCEKYNICDEINLFGILGNWNKKGFETVIEDFSEPVKVRVYDEDKKLFTYIRTKEMYRDYVNKIFNHLLEKGLWEKTKIMADQPKKVSDISESEKFIKEIRKDVKIKYAIMMGDFYLDYKGDTDSFSIILNELVRVNKGGLKLSEKSDLKNMTWYVCWTPYNLNQFVSSPPSQSLLVGYMTYLFDMKGFLRWNYCLYPDSNDYRYKSDRWACGDMFFVYPSKSGTPELSLRYMQLIYGTKDYTFLRLCEKKLGRDKVISIVERLTGKFDDLSYNENTREISGSFKDDYELVENIKRELVKEYKKISNI